MAYIANQPKREQTIEDKNKELMLNTGASSSTGMSQLGGPTNPAAQNQPKFQNIQGMLGANKAAGSELTGGITSKIGGEIAQQKKKVGKAESDIGATAQAIQSGKDTTSGALASLNKDLTEDKQVAAAGITEGTKNTFGGKDYTYTSGQWKDASGGTFNIPTAQPQPEATALDYSALSGENKDNLSKLTGFSTGTTQQKQGEDLTTNVTKFQDIGAAAQKQAAQRMGQLGSAEGRTSLLQEMISRGQRPYSSGASALDQAFMQRQGGTAFKQQQGDLRARQKELVENVKAGQLSGDIAKQTLSESKTLSKDVQRALGITEDDFAAAQRKEADDITTRNVTDSEVLSKFQSQGFANLSEADKTRIKELLLNTAGVNVGTRLYNVDPSKYTQYAGAVTSKDVVTQDEANKYNVLQALRGLQGDVFSKAGEVDKTKTGFKSDLGTAIQQAEDVFKFNIANQKINPYMTGIGGSSGSVYENIPIIGNTVAPTLTGLFGGGSGSSGWTAGTKGPITLDSLLGNTLTNKDFTHSSQGLMGSYDDMKTEYLKGLADLKGTMYESTYTPPDPMFLYRSGLFNTTPGGLTNEESNFIRQLMVTPEDSGLANYDEQQNRARALIDKRNAWVNQVYGQQAMNALMPGMQQQLQDYLKTQGYDNYFGGELVAPSIGKGYTPKF